MTSNLEIRKALDSDKDLVWEILEECFRAGDTYTIDSDISKNDAFAYWFAPDKTVYVAELDGEIMGTYYIKTNQLGGGDHVCNCGYITHSKSRGKGIAKQMCLHSLDEAKKSGYKAMQFNFVVKTNEAAVALWKKLGFMIVGTLPHAFLHSKLGYVDAYVMYRDL